MNYYLIAGEASGDLHGANLIKALRLQDPKASFRAWGGDLMQEAGATLVKHYRDLAYMGFWEVFTHLPEIFRNIRLAQKELTGHPPDLLILIDYPGFNLRIARFARKAGIRVFYYISPQLWAWKSSRVKTIKECVDRMAVILPFEPGFYAAHGYRADYVGHPLLDQLDQEVAQTSRSEFLHRNNLPDKPIIALLPGSRRQEIQTMLPRMLEVIPSFPDYQFVVAGAPSVPEPVYHGITGMEKATLVHQQTYSLLRCATAALVTSGTATLETALIGVPEVVCYRGSSLSFWIARKLVHVRFISLVNLIMEREVVRELIQHQLTRTNLIAETRRLLDPVVRETLGEAYGQLRSKLGGIGASGRTASLITHYLQEKTVNP